MHDPDYIASKEDGGDMFMAGKGDRMMAILYVDHISLKDKGRAYQYTTMHHLAFLTGANRGSNIGTTGMDAGSQHISTGLYLSIQLCCQQLHCLIQDD